MLPYWQAKMTTIKMFQNIIKYFSYWTNTWKCFFWTKRQLSIDSVLFSSKLLLQNWYVIGKCFLVFVTLLKKKISLLTCMLCLPVKTPSFIFVQILKLIHAWRLHIFFTKYHPQIEMILMNTKLQCTSTPTYYAVNQKLLW